MSGFNDPDKLRDALQLSKSFKGLQQSKPKKKGNAKAPSHPPPPPPPSRAPGSQRQSSRVGPPPGHCATTRNVPPPSQRNYAGVSTFQGGNGNLGRAIGSVGVDFLLRQDQPKLQSSAQGRLPQVPVSRSSSSNAVALNIQDFKAATGSGRQISSTSSFVLLRPEDASRHRAASNASLLSDAESNEAPPNILDTFFSLVARKPSAGQTLTGQSNFNLPIATNTNIPTKMSSAASPAEYAPSKTQDLKTSQGITQQGLPNAVVPSGLRLNTEFEKRLKVLKIARAPGAPRTVWRDKE